MTTTTRREAPEKIEAAATAIANARGARRGMPPIVNILEMLKGMKDGKLYRELMEDARAALEAADLLPASVGGDGDDGRELHAAAINVMNWWDAWLSKQRHDPVLEEAEWKEFLALRSAVARYSEGITVLPTTPPPGEKS